MITLMLLLGLGTTNNMPYLFPRQPTATSPLYFGLLMFKVLPTDKDIQPIVRLSLECTILS